MALAIMQGHAQRGLLEKGLFLQIKNKKLKWGVAITTFVCTAFGLPVYAVHYSNSKLAG